MPYMLLNVQVGRDNRRYHTEVFRMCTKLMTHVQVLTRVYCVPYMANALFYVKPITYFDFSGIASACDCQG